MFDRTLPILGVHTILKAHEGVNAAIRLIEEGLAPRGVNTLILEYRPQFRCFPEFSTGTVTYEDANRIADVCEGLGIRLIPLLPCLSHQSAGPRANPYPLFHAHPELLERQGIDPGLDWPHFALHSWCASNDDVYQYIFPMMAEMAEACRAEAVHVGLDELFDVALCERCKGKTPAQLYARTVKLLHDHLASKGLAMFIWGDRLLDSESMGYSMWEGDRFGVHPALQMKDQVTPDIIVCDWHYEWHSRGYPSVEALMKAGFTVLPSFWRNPDNADHFWLHALEGYYLGNHENWAGKLGGMLLTNWRPLDDAYVDEIFKGMEGIGTEMPAKGVGEVIARMLPKGRKLFG